MFAAVLSLVLAVASVVPGAAQCDETGLDPARTDVINMINKAPQVPLTHSLTRAASCFLMFTHSLHDCVTLLINTSLTHPLLHSPLTQLNTNLFVHSLTHSLTHSLHLYNHYTTVSRY
jgi:hypothetical protein